MEKKETAGIIAAGLALFSMFFGAGDLIWPLILGGKAASNNFYAMLGLLLSGVTLPLLGLLAMMLFQGDYHAFFGRLGKIPAVIIIFIVQAILGPLGSIPRLITLSYATLKPYFSYMTPTLFSIVFSLIVVFFVIKKQRLIDIMGYILTPILLLSLIIIFVLGFSDPPEALSSIFTKKEAFMEGLSTGYNTLDLIASFIFAPLVLTYFVRKEHNFNCFKTRKLIFKRMLKSSLLAAFLLSGMYIGLTYISASYTSLLPRDHSPEERLAEISFYLLGAKGGLVSCIAVIMACLTTAISITVIVSEYISKNLLKEKGGKYLPIFITLGISAVLANLGFMGIANLLSPILVILCPGLIVLSVLNILHKLYEMHFKTRSVFTAFTASTLIGYVIVNYV